MELRGDAILLREFASEDLEALHAVHSDPNVLRYYASDVGTREQYPVDVDSQHESGSCLGN
jgi:hypothetical protein